MNYPSVKTLAAKLKLDLSHAKRVRQLMDGSLDPLKYLEVRLYCATSANSPDRRTLQLRAIDLELDGRGVETLHRRRRAPMMEYINTGAASTNTVIYDYTRSRWLVMSWAAWAERETRQERNS